MSASYYKIERKKLSNYTEQLGNNVYRAGKVLSGEKLSLFTSFISTT